MRKWTFGRSWIAGLAIALLVLGGMMLQGELSAAGGTAPAAQSGTLPKPKLLKKEIGKAVTEGKFRVVRGKLSIEAKDGKAHDLTLEVKQAKVKGDGDFLATVTDLTASMTQVATVDPTTGAATFAFKNTSLVCQFNPDETVTVEGKKLSIDDAAELMVNRTLNDSTAELFAGMAEALLVDPQAGLGPTLAGGMSCQQKKAACIKSYGAKSCTGPCG